MFSCGTVFKVEDIAKHYKMNPPDQYCWPVLLSKKKGAAALSLCPEHGSHGGLKGKMHARPNNFDLDYIYKHFTRKPTLGRERRSRLGSGQAWQALMEGTGAPISFASLACCECQANGQATSCVLCGFCGLLQSWGSCVIVGKRYAGNEELAARSRANSA